MMQSLFKQTTGIAATYNKSWNQQLRRHVSDSHNITYGRRRRLNCSSCFYFSSHNPSSMPFLSRHHGIKTRKIHDKQQPKSLSMGKEVRHRDRNISDGSCRYGSYFIRYASTSSNISHHHIKKKNDIPFLLADIGEGIKEVELIKWYVTIGQTVEQFDKICLIQSDKATVEITSRYDGIITSLNEKNVGDMIQVGEPLLFLRSEEGEEEHYDDTESSKDFSETDTLVSALEDSINSKIPTLDVLDDTEEKDIGLAIDGTAFDLTPAATEVSQTRYSDIDDDNISESHSLNKRSDTSNRFEASPAVRKLVNDYGINATSIHGTGPKGRILKSDLLSYLEERGLLQSQKTSDNNDLVQNIETIDNAAISSTNDHEEDEIITLKGYNRLMYKAMTESLKIPQMGYGDEIVMNTLMQCRKEMNRSRKPNEEKISLLALLIKACSLALKDYPIVNSIIHNDSQMELCMKKSHNIGIAMNTQRGLVVPVIQQCNILSTLSIQKELNRLKYCASTSVLAESDLKNATITLSNIGSIGGTYMNPVVVTPTIAIGAFGKIQTVPRFVPTFLENIDHQSNNNTNKESSLQQHNIYAADIMYISWSADHRYLDGAALSQFSNAFKQYIENPYSMLKDLR